jgi:biotin carboxyl carrier protein
MTFEIDIAGRCRHISIDRIAPGRYRVILDGRAHAVDAVRAGEFALSLIFADDGATSREIHVAPGASRDEVLIGLDGRTIPVRINGRRRGSGTAGPGTHMHGAQEIIAPMPGRVVRVLVAPGDVVHARQAVVVVEAMKMENELRSPKNGRVSEVTVGPGTSVEAGRVLVVIE